MKPVRSEINVTPLVDVCLVLLIIFMVVSDKLSRGRDVVLPKSENYVTSSEELVVSVANQSGRRQVFWDREAIGDLAELTKRTASARTHRALVKADANLSYGEVYPVLVALRDGGASGVELATRRD